MDFNLSPCQPISHLTLSDNFAVYFRNCVNQFCTKTKLKQTNSINKKIQNVHPFNTEIYIPVILRSGFVYNLTLSKLCTFRMFFQTQKQAVVHTNQNK